MLGSDNYPSDEEAAAEYDAEHGWVDAADMEPRFYQYLVEQVAPTRPTVVRSRTRPDRWYVLHTDGTRDKFTTFEEAVACARPQH
jgi:hypothetical protein